MRYGAREAARARRQRVSIHYRVLMEPIGTNIFFLATRPRFLNGVYRLVSTERGGAVYDLDPGHPISLVRCRVGYRGAEAAGFAECRGAVSHGRGRLPAASRHSILGFPCWRSKSWGSPRITYDQATTIERYLATHFGYTLELPGATPKDPLADFLFVRKKGHCEYFASSMAIMLRTLGVPSRVVNGFRTIEFNDLTGTM